MDFALMILLGSYLDRVFEHTTPAGRVKKSEKDVRTLLRRGEWWRYFCYWACRSTTSEHDTIGARPAHYNVNMTGIQVGLEFLNLTADVNMTTDKKVAVIDSGTTLAYLPEGIYNPLVKKILSWQLDIKLRTLHDQYTCFDYSGSWDEWVCMNRLMKHTPENILKQRALDKKAGVDKNAKSGHSAQPKPKHSVDARVDKDETKNNVIKEGQEAEI